MSRLKIAFPYVLFAAMALGVVYWSNVRQRPADPRPAGEPDQRTIDPVCRMDVNPDWGCSLEHEGVTYHFCVELCRKQFAANPDAYVGERCLVCNAPVTRAAARPATYMGATYYLCSDEHRTAFKADPAGFFMHRMWGIPDWLYYVSIAAVLLVSFVMFEGAAAFRRRTDTRLAGERSGNTAREGGPGPSAATAAQSPAVFGASFMQAPSLGAFSRGGASAAISLPVIQPTASADRIDLMRFAPIRFLLTSRPFRFLCQLVMVLLFLLIIAAGLFGSQNPGLNIAPILTWTIWWGGLVVLIMFAGKAWCYVCPWDAIAGWTERMAFWRKRDDGLGLNLRWPRVVRNISIATILFVGLTWIEIGFGVTMNPRVTAWLAVAMLVMAVVSAFLFDRKSFCRYGCLVGRVSGLYALFSGVEIRPRDREACRACRSKECVRGSGTAYGCPTYEYPGRMETNTYCIQCTECLQACPHGNLAVNLRPWGEDLKALGKPRSDEAYLALLMLALTGFHGLTMTPAWRGMTAWLETAAPIGRIGAFSLGMAAIMAFPVLIYGGLIWVSYRIAGPASGRNAAPDAAAPRSTYYDYFVRYAYCLLPIALFYHLAHNLEHLLMEGQKVVALISDPFGWGWNAFGTAGWVVPPLVSLDVLWVLQVLLVGVGHVYSLWAANRISRRLFADPRAAARGQWPMLVGMIAFSVLSLWLLKQPMEMRTSAM
jgi:YHS domain-containing protein/ferredoxin